MKIPVKALSVILVLASLVGLAGGGMGLKDTMASKAYYESMAGEGGSIDTLEDGIQTLKENEPAYQDGLKSLEEGRAALEEGRAAYEAGKAQLEEGQKAYDEGKKLLDEKQAEYDEGVKKLEEAEKQLKDGYQTLVNNHAKYEDGKAQIAQYEAGMASIAQYEQVQAAVAAAEADAATLGQAQALAAGVASTASAYSLSTEDAISAVASSQGLPVSIVKEAVEKVAQYNYAKQVLAAKADEYNAGKAMLAAKQADYESGKAQLKEYELGSARYYDGKRAYEAGKKQLEEGAVALEEGKAKLEEAGKQLEEGRAKLADAEQQLKDGEKQLADGEKQLAAFENGRTQVIDGLKTAIGTGDVAERLGAGFDFMRDKENIDYAKAQQVVDAARAYAGDLTAAVTKELTNKAIASGATLFASLLAIIAGILGFAGKLPALGGLSIGALVAGAVGLILAFTAGNTYSAAAGATSANLLLAGGAADAVAGLLGTIGGLGAKKTPVS